MMIERASLTPIFAGIVLFVYGLNIPYISYYILAAAVFALLFKCIFQTEYDRKFTDRLLLLVFFALTYYSFTTIHGITEFNEGVKNILAIIGAYALGFSVKTVKRGDYTRTLLPLMLLMISGYLIFSLLSVYSFLQTSGLVEIVERAAPNFWDGSEINAPELGANASLGMCLLPAVLLGKDDQFKGLFYLMVSVFITLLFAAGIYVNIALQNRTPFLAAAAAMFFGTLIYLFKHKANPSNAVKKLAIFGGLAGLLIFYLINTLDLTHFNIMVRFAEERLESARYEAWQTMLTSLHHSLLGGRVVQLGEARYVHNLWLDVFWDAGFVPFIFLVIFHLKHAAFFKRILGSKLPLFVTLMIVGLGTSFFINFMQQPTLSASVPYFAAGCFFLGLLFRISQEMEEGDDLP